MVEGVIFDMDGLMFDTERVGMEVWGKCLAQAGYTFTEEVGQAIRGCNTAGIHNALHQYYGKEIDCPTIHEQVRKEMEVQMQQEGVPVKDGLFQLLEWLKSKNIPRVVASSSRRQTVVKRCAEAGILEDFDGIICGDMVEHSKPDPDIFLKAARLIGANPEHCIVLEDSFNGIRAGHAGGFITLMIPDLDQPTAEIKKLYTDKLQSLTDVLEGLKNNCW